MQIIIPAVVLLVFLVFIFIRIQKQRRLLDEAANYESRLKEVRLIRWQYLQSLENSRQVLKECEQLNGNLNIIKAEVRALRSETRDMLRALNYEIRQSTGSILDQRTIAQMKADFSERWRSFNLRKRFCRDLRATVQQAEDRKEEALKTELNASHRWFSEKEQVMLQWRDLSSRIKITDPHRFFS